MTSRDIPTDGCGACNTNAFPMITMPLQRNGGFRPFYAGNAVDDLIWVIEDGRRVGDCVGKHAGRGRFVGS